MTSFHTNKSAASDALLNGSLSDFEGEDTSPDDDEVLQLERIDEYRNDSLRGDDPLESSIGGLTGGLMKFAVRYEQKLTELLKVTDGAIHDSPELHRSMTIYLNISRQVDRFVNLASRLAENRQRVASIKSQRGRAIVPGSITGPDQRNKR